MVCSSNGKLGDNAFSSEIRAKAKSPWLVTTTSVEFSSPQAHEILLGSVIPLRLDHALDKVRFCFGILDGVGCRRLSALFPGTRTPMGTLC